jgi:hypothetical protein
MVSREWSTFNVFRPEWLFYFFFFFSFFRSL